MSRPVYFNQHKRTFSIKIRLPNREKVSWDNIKIACPRCGSTYCVCNGHAQRKGGKVQGLRCENCGKQFKFHTSKNFVAKLEALLRDACEEAVAGGACQGTLARKWGMSDTTMSKIVRSLKALLVQSNRAVALLDAKVKTTLVSMDEAFFTVGGKRMLLIVARNGEGKTLAFAISKTRSKDALKKVFDQAESQMESPTEILLTDGLNAYQGMARDLKRPVMHAIHIHKPPFNRLVVRHITYEENHRVELTAAMKTNILVKRRKREVRYIVTKKYIGPPRKRGRKKGQSPRRRKPPALPSAGGKKKRGPKYGLGTLHRRGKKAYVKVDPSRRTVRGVGNVPLELVQVIKSLQDEFGKKHVVNNISEYGISQFRRGVPLSGPQSVEGLEARSSIFFHVKNGGVLEVPPEITRHFSPRLALRSILSTAQVLSGNSQLSLTMQIKEAEV